MVKILCRSTWPKLSFASAIRLPSTNFSSEMNRRSARVKAPGERSDRMCLERMNRHSRLSPRPTNHLARSIIVRHMDVHVKRKTSGRDCLDKIKR